MPIYEYLCPACNRIFSFLSSSAAAGKEPVCPQCGGTGLRKQLSRFAVVGAVRKSKGDAAASAAGAPPDAPGAVDDPRIEREMERLMADADGIDETDPRQLGRLMRRMGQITGEGFDPEMESAVRRLESGEDPEKIEEDMGGALGGGGDEAGEWGGAPPSRDGGLYSM